MARLSGRRWHGRSDTAADIGIESILSGSVGRVGAGRTSTLSTRTTSQARCRRHKNADTLRRTGIPSTPLTSSGWAELERLRPRLRAAYSNKRVGKSALAKARSWHWHQPNATQRNATQRNASPPPPLRFWRPAGNRTRDCRSNSLPRYPLDHNDTVCPSVSGIGIYCLGWVLRLACLRCRARAAPGTRAARPVPARSAHVRAARARARPAPPHRQLTHVRSFVSFLWLLWFFLGSGALGTRAARPCSLARARAQRTRARCARTLTHRRAPRRQLTHSPSFRLVARLGPEGGCWVGLRSGQRVGAGADVGTLCCTAVCQRARPSVRLLVCPSVRLSVCPSVRLSVCPSVRLSVCPVAERDLAGSAGGICWMGSLAQ